ncbi:UNVERIFIED_CONTAM: ORF B protein (apicoplast) [Hammondia hammondi]|eukprot:XP_008889610.1 ORF B protein (apicoplast) [Hammondia hammondi]
MNKKKVIINKLKNKKFLFKFKIFIFKTII